MIQPQRAQQSERWRFTTVAAPLTLLRPHLLPGYRLPYRFRQSRACTAPPQPLPQKGEHTRAAERVLPVEPLEAELLGHAEGREDPAGVGHGGPRGGDREDVVLRARLHEQRSRGDEAGDIGHLADVQDAGDVSSVGRSVTAVRRSTHITGQSRPTPSQALRIGAAAVGRELASDRTTPRCTDRSRNARDPASGPGRTESPQGTRTSRSQWGRTSCRR
jgi:hypothetical protein